MVRESPLTGAFHERDMRSIEQWAGLDLADASTTLEGEDEVVGREVGEEEGGSAGAAFEGVVQRPLLARILSDAVQDVGADGAGPVPAWGELDDLLKV